MTAILLSTFQEYLDPYDTTIESVLESGADRRRSTEEIAMSGINRSDWSLLRLSLPIIAVIAGGGGFLIDGSVAYSRNRIFRRVTRGTTRFCSIEPRVSCIRTANVILKGSY